MNNDLKRRAFFWDILLGTYSPSVDHISEEDLLNTQLNLPEQRTIQMDVPRTRPQQIPQKNHKFLELMITKFCKTEKLSYKQGINEIFGVVCIFGEQGLQWTKVYEYGRKIIQDNNFFKDKEFNSLQTAFQFINMLLRFHDVELFEYLNSQSLTPELYATPWILTIFSNKMSIDCTLLLWESLFTKRDQLLVYFLVISILITYRQKLLSIDVSFLPQTLTGIYIDQVSDLKKIFHKAIDLKLNTPQSGMVPERLFDLTKFQLQQLQYDNMYIKPAELIKLMKKKCTNCNQKGCQQCRPKTIPQEMRHFISQNKLLQEMVEYQGGIQKTYKIFEQQPLEKQENTIIVISNMDCDYEDVVIKHNYVCFLEGGTLAYQQETLEDDDTQSTSSQGSGVSSQIIIPFKSQMLNKVILQQQPKRAPEESVGFETVTDEQNKHPNYDLVEPLIIVKKESRISSLHKKDPQIRYQKLGLLRQISLQVQKLYQFLKIHPFQVYKVKIYGSQKPRILILSQENLILLKWDHYVWNVLEQFNTLNPAHLDLQYKVQIKSMFYTIFLKKITSKKLNSSVISFYYKQPQFQDNYSSLQIQPDYQKQKLNFHQK
ncbi:hypothetical protein pb186bvf_012469 [Paramecium bursaria]